VFLSTQSSPAIDMTEMMIVMELVECHRENYTHNFPQIHRSENEIDAPIKSLLL
tara:strand:- start:94982 stop:95143 length:162 start_codon:yes stop_codon:yes gene_type:complete